MAGDPFELCVPGRAIDPRALHGYLCFSYVPTPHTLFAGVAKLPAGFKLEFRDGRQVITPAGQWRERDLLATTEPEAVETLRTLLRASVCRQIEDETRIGLFLSGGLDSSLIAALLTELGVRPHLFTLDFGPPWNAELPLARIVADHLRLPLEVVPAGPKQIAGAVSATAAALHQPFGDGVTVPLYLLGQAAARRCDVVFNGEGGDQLFGGWTNKPLIAAELYGGASFDRERAYLGTFHRFWDATDRLYSVDARRRIVEIDEAEWLRPSLDAPGFDTLLHRLRAANLTLKGAQSIAPRMVQLAECHGLKVRAPFFDRALAEWSFGLPPEWLLQGACEKHLLKHVAARYFPDEVVWQDKRGMGVPLTDWCLGSLRRTIARRIDRRRVRRAGLFDADYVARLCAGDGAELDFRWRRLGEKVWALYFLHVWADMHGLALTLDNLSDGDAA